MGSSSTRILGVLLAVAACASAPACEGNPEGTWEQCPSYSDTHVPETGEPCSGDWSCTYHNMCVCNGSFRCEGGHVVNGCTPTTDEMRGAAGCPGYPSADSGTPDGS